MQDHTSASDQDDTKPLVAAEPERVRKIIHADKDAFYASAEQRDYPALRGGRWFRERIGEDGHEGLCPVIVGAGCADTAF